jgi:hypothetical protein
MYVPKGTEYKPNYQALIDVTQYQVRPLRTTWAPLDIKRVVPQPGFAGVPGDMSGSDVRQEVFTEDGDASVVTQKALRDRRGLRRGTDRTAHGGRARTKCTTYTLLTHRIEEPGSLYSVVANVEHKPDPGKAFEAFAEKYTKLIVGSQEV